MPDSRPRKSAAAIREAEYETFVKQSLQSHGGYIAKPILSLAESLEILPLHTSCIVGAVIVAFHLVLPAFLLPHFSALITLISPVQATMTSVSREVNKSSSKDAAQWCLYWVIYTLFELVRGLASVYQPGSSPFFEFGRTLCLVICGGPWFGKAGLVSVSVTALTIATRSPEHGAARGGEGGSGKGKGRKAEGREGKATIGEGG